MQELFDCEDLAGISDGSVEVNISSLRKGMAAWGSDKLHSLFSRLPEER